MRLSYLVGCVAACALIAGAPAFARGGGHNGGGHYGGGHGGGYHGGGYHGGGYHGGGGFRGGYGGGFRGGYYGSSFGLGFGYPYGFGYPNYGGYYGGFYDPYFYPRRSTVIVKEAAREAPAFPDGFAAGQGAPPKQSWYFCQDSGQYYPYVRTCASAWQEVPAIPPPPAPNEAR